MIIKVAEKNFEAHSKKKLIGCNWANNDWMALIVWIIPLYRLYYHHKKLWVWTFWYRGDSAESFSYVTMALHIICWKKWMLRNRAETFVYFIISSENFQDKIMVARLSLLCLSLCAMSVCASSTNINRDSKTLCETLRLQNDKICQ